MSVLQKNRKILLVAGGVLLAFVLFVVLIPRWNVPPPQIHSYLIFEGSVSRAIVTEGHAKSQAGKFSPPRLPQSLEFESNPGPVDVYVLDFSMGDPTQIERMMTMTDQLKAGRPPEQFVANAKGVTGRIDLHSWPYGRVKYLVLLHAEKESEVTLKVHYGP